MLYEPDVNRIIVPAPNEFLRAVEGIDQKEGAAMRRDAAGGDFLLRDHRHAWGGLGQRREDDQLGGAVGLRDRRQIALLLDVEAAGDDLQDRRAGVPGGLG